LQSGFSKIKLKRYRFLFIILFIFSGCATARFERFPSSKSVTPKDSPKALKPIGTIGDTKLGSSFLSHPTGIATGPEGNFFIADTGNDRVVKCDGEGKFVKETGGFGWEE